jgi:hypothetical protein
MPAASSAAIRFVGANAVRAHKQSVGVQVRALPTLLRCLAKSAIRPRELLAAGHL